LAEERYFTAAEPVLLRGEPGTGKTILPSVSGWAHASSSGECGW
jgi:ATP-dependent 26S proteasome regulatory subunit